MGQQVRAHQVGRNWLPGYLPLTVVAGDAGDGLHVLFDGTDGLTALVDSLPLKQG